MTLSGKWSKQFAVGHAACAVGLSMNSDYHLLFHVTDVDGGFVSLRSNRGGGFRLKIRRGKHCQFATLEQSSSYERMCRMPDRKTRIEPFELDTPHNHREAVAEAAK